MTRTPLRSLFRALRRHRRDEEGATTIEFVLWFPFFVTLLCSSLEAGIYSLQTSMLERSLDLTVRDLRIGALINPSHKLLKEEICERAVILNKCDDLLLVELFTVPKPAWTMPKLDADCIDLSEEVQPVTTFQPGLKNEMVMVRACIKVKPLFPTTGLGAAMPRDGTGKYFQMIATSGFVNEPR